MSPNHKSEPGWGNVSALTRSLQLGCQSLNWGHVSSRSLLFYPCLCLSEATRRPSWGRLIVAIKDLAETTQRCWCFSLWKFLCKIIIETALELGDWERENGAFIFLNYLQKNKIHSYYYFLSPLFPTSNSALCERGPPSTFIKRSIVTSLDYNNVSPSLLDVLANAIRQEKEVKDPQIGEKENYLCLQMA